MEIIDDNEQLMSGRQLYTRNGARIDFYHRHLWFFSYLSDNCPYIRFLVVKCCIIKVDRIIVESFKSAIQCCNTAESANKDVWSLMY